MPRALGEEHGARSRETEVSLPELVKGKGEKSHQSLEKQLQRSEIFIEIRFQLIRIVREMQYIKALATFRTKWKR